MKVMRSCNAASLLYADIWHGQSTGYRACMISVRRAVKRLLKVAIYALTKLGGGDTLYAKLVFCAGKTIRKCKRDFGQCHVIA